MKSLKIRLDLTNKQTTLCRQHAGVARHAYNWGVAECQQAFDNKEKIPSAIDLHKRLVAEVKTANPFYYQVSKCAPQQALRNLQTAYTNFHRIQKPSGYKKRKTLHKMGAVVTVLEGLPQFKKKGQRDGFYLEGSIRTDGKAIKLPHLGWVRCAELLPDCPIKNVSITRTADHWYISFRVAFEPVKTEKQSDIVAASTVGVDLGIKTLATLSDNTVFQSVKPYKRHKRKLKLAQRKVSKKYRKGVKRQSKNYAKAQAKVARLHARIANIRADALHKLTTHLAKNHSRIVIEDLNVRGMSKNHKLASALLDGGFFEFRRQLTYKADWYGSELVVADRFFASSKTCSGCGCKKSVLKLSERTYHCESCGLQIDRDLNAAINLKHYTVSYTGSACGATNNRT
ncbi:RNA-guided endonuclease TnpB family protein, partial [Microcoleus sp. herbarium14]|uniref:RNA-guided endonuclease InsQ/TnpB family protein n=1 Tax=Microcoleus sp. herbarium14 TaxID=3055439 RepID=UPI002FD11D66